MEENSLDLVKFPPKILHKRVASTNKCDPYEYQVCDGKNINSNKMTSAELEQWKMFQARFRWSDVNCPTCLSLKAARPKDTKINPRRKKVNLYLGGI